MEDILKRCMIEEKDAGALLLFLSVPRPAFLTFSWRIP
jgi:hypothetical protein